MDLPTVADTPTFAYNRDQIIRRALRQCGAIAAGETPGAQEVTDAGDALNALVASWQASGLHIWKEKEATLFLQPGVYQYSLGSNNTTNVAPAKNVVNITLGSSSIAAGATVVVVSSWDGPYYQPANNYSSTFSDFNADFNSDFGGTVPLSVGDSFGVMMANNQLFWTTVAAASGFQITLSDPLPGPVNGSAQAFTYPNLVAGTSASCAIYRPLRVLNVRRILWSSLIETMTTPLSRIDYRNMPNKTTPGIVTQYYYDPQLTSGQFWAWPCPQDSLNGLNFTYMEPIFDFNTAADYPDFPQEWVNALVWNLANEIGIEYDLGGERAARIEKRAMESLDLVSGWDREPESFYLGVNWDQMAR